MSLFAKKYRIDYSGAKASYAGAKDKYRAGQTVTLYYPIIATDTDYTFELDGKALQPDYDEAKGFILRFVMPEHDVALRCRSVNTMVYVPDSL